MNKILLIDPNKKIREKIIKELQPKLSPLARLESYDLHAKNLFDFENLNVDLLRKELASYDLIILHESFSTLINQLNKNTIYIILREGNQKKTESLCRIETSQEWLSLLLEKLNQKSSFKQEDKNILAFFYTFNPEMRMAYFERLIAYFLDQNKRIFILPFKPLYNWYYDAKFHQGANLSDLVFKLEQNMPVNYQDIGHIFEKQKSAYFIARPWLGQEDIFTCQNKNLINLTKLFKEFIEKSPKDTLGLIDCEGIPFSLIENLAFLSNYAYFDMPTQDDFSGEKSKELLGEFLAKKPASCHFETLNKKFKDL